MIILFYLVGVQVSDNDSTLNFEADELAHEISELKARKFVSEWDINYKIRQIENGLFFLISFLIMLYLDSRSYFDSYGTYGIWFGSVLFFISFMGLFANYVSMFIARLSKTMPVLNDYKNKHPAAMSAISIVIISSIVIMASIKYFEVDVNNLITPIVAGFVILIASSHSKITDWFKKE